MAQMRLMSMDIAAAPISTTIMIAKITMMTPFRFRIPGIPVPWITNLVCGMSRISQSFSVKPLQRAYNRSRVVLHLAGLMLL
jgi:hypothetical protein